MAAARGALPVLAGVVAAIAFAVGMALLITRVVLAPSAREMRDLAAYLIGSSAVAVAGGWLVLRLAERAFVLSVRARTFLAAALGGAVALFNVLAVAELMFVSTAHDLKLLLVLVAFSGAITLLFTYAAAAAVTARVESVAAGVRALARGAYGARVHVPGRDELARLADDVNALGRELARATEQRAALDRERRELTAAVSHDLRTPLASVRAMVEALDDAVVDDPEEVRRYYAALRRETDRLSRMIDDLFELAWLDAGAPELELRILALDEVAAEVVDAMQAQALLAQVTLTSECDGALPELALDGARIERAVANLVRNALAHTPAGGRVRVAARADGAEVVLRVEDSGSGIDASDLPHVWERFYRAEKSRSRSPGSPDGAGLGLAIVRGIVEAHGGRVEVDSAPGRGSTFSLVFPATRRTAAGERSAPAPRPSR